MIFVKTTLLMTVAMSENWIGELRNKKLSNYLSQKKKMCNFAKNILI